MHSTQCVGGGGAYVRVGVSGLMPQRAHTTNLKVTLLSHVSTFCVMQMSARTHMRVQGKVFKRAVA